MKGRPPKPSILRVIEGNRGHRPLPSNEPKPVACVPTCPKHLSPTAKVEWRRVTRELAHLGLVTRVDRGVLATYCEAWARWIKAEEMTQKYGEVLRVAKKASSEPVGQDCSRSHGANSANRI